MTERYILKISPVFRFLFVGTCWILKRNSLRIFRPNGRAFGRKCLPLTVEFVFRGNLHIALIDY